MADSLTPRVRTAPPAATALDQILDEEWHELEGEGSQAPRQILPPQTHMAQVITSAAHDEDSAVAESRENLSLALGTRFRRPGREDVRDDRVRGRLLLEQLARQVNRINPAHLHAMQERFPDLPAVPDPLALLRREGVSAGASALILAFWLGRPGLDETQRRRLRRALDDATCAEGWALELFGEWVCGDTTPALSRQLAQLYRHASCREQSMAQWFDACRQMPDRGKRLEALLRTLGFELGAQGAAAESARLATVIEDVRRVLLFMTLESQCAVAAGVVGIDTDTMIAEMLAMLDQPWMDAGWLAMRSARLGVTSPERSYALTRELTTLTQWTHDACFRDGGQREMLLTALAKRRSALAGAGDDND